MKYLRFNWTFVIGEKCRPDSLRSSPRLRNNLKKLTSLRWRYIKRLKDFLSSLLFKLLICLFLLCLFWLRQICVRSWALIGRERKTHKFHWPILKSKQTTGPFSKILHLEPKNLNYSLQSYSNHRKNPTHLNTQFKTISQELRIQEKKLPISMAS